MFLKNIELENFKSFGKKTVISFRKGYTAITGPNGSGKSNIGDALLFVLGTKSNKSLRAQKLTDLIYKGPNGKMASYLKASVTFENTDRSIPLESNEVTFTRVVKLTEDNNDYTSTYYINGEKARLQDFEFLLERAKIFADGYNFVRQGDITRIIEMSPNERRQILEEVGGITAYNEELEKARAEKDKVTENLVTVTAVLNEISTRVQLLSSEKEVAESYLSKKKRITELEGTLLYRRKYTLESEIAALTQQITKIKEEILNNENEVSKLAKESEEIETQIKGMEGDRKSIENLNKLKSDIDAIKIQIAKLEMERENSLSRINQIKTDLARMKKEADEGRKKYDSLSKEKEIVNGRIHELEAKLSMKENDKKSIEDKNAVDFSQSKQIIEKIDEIHVKRDEVISAISDLKNKLSALDAQRSSVMKNISEIEEAIGSLEFSVKDIDWRLKNSAQSPKESAQLKKRYMELKDQISNLRAKEISMNKEIEGLQNELGKAQGSRLTGIWESIDFIMRESANGNLKGVMGTVDSLIKYDRSMEKAVQAAGGNRLYSIIMDNDENSQIAIELLKKKGKGRLTFLPLNKLIPMRPKGKSLLLMNDSKTMGLLINHIEYPKEIEAAVTYVFSDTILCKDLATAREVMGGVRIVTLDGDLIDPTNAMTGGTLAQRGLDKNVEQLNSRLSTLRADRDNISREIEELDQEMRKIAEELNELNLKTGQQEGAMQQLRDRKNEIEKEVALKKDTLEKKKYELSGLEKNKAELEFKLGELNRELDSLDQELAVLQKKKEKFLDSEARERLRELDEEIVGLRTQLNSENSKLSSIETELSALNERMSLLATQKKTLENEMGELNSKISKASGEIDDARRKYESMSLVFERLQNELKQKENKMLELLNRRNEIINKIESLKTVNKTNFDFKLQLDSKLDDSKRKMDEIMREIQEKNVEEIKLNMSNEDIRKEISLLETQLKQMEPVNLKAIEDYANERARLDDYSSKKEKLQEEMNKLNELEKKLEEQKKVVFLDVFREVNKNFITIYSELTNGQEGYLELENVTNPFMGGLNLKASSKGKKVDNLVSLSGGEKSLAALAFILAIQEYDPSPIYFMDEVDMFLDGVNAENVGRLFRRNSERAQIISVTLRKSTMKYAHQMIGVSYQDRSSAVFTKDLLQEVTMA